MTLFEISWLAWPLSELAIFLRDRRPATGDVRDEGSRRLIILAIAASLTASCWAATHLRQAAFPSQWVRWPGEAAMWAGIALRLWAVHTLGRFFRTHVTLLTDHRLVRAGPYWLIRHPAYSGALLTCTGFGLALANGVALAIMLVVPGLALARRIDVEERALHDRFGSEWDVHRHATWALLPPIW